MDRKIPILRQMLKRLAHTTALTSFVWLAASSGAHAQTAPTQDQIKALQDQINQLQAAVNALKAQQHTDQPARAPETIVQSAPGATGAPGVAQIGTPTAAPQIGASTAGAQSSEHAFLEHKKGDALTFYTPGGEVTAYGRLDLSIDVATKDLSKSEGAVGRGGWLPDISTNISYLGVRGHQQLPDIPLSFVYQLETQIDVAATSGTAETNSNQSNAVKGALTSRNSYIGLAGDDWGAVKIGKTDAPYKNATQSMNPFSGMLGDYQVIMGNTGGDNRVEFGTRLDHSIWYESPRWNDFTFAALYSPGQNRASNSDNIASGESDCTGGNIPGSGGIIPVSCSDGSFSDAMSASLTYESGPLKIIGAYERHMKVNRSSDITGLYGSGVAYGALLESQDTADEDAGKVGIQYSFSKTTSVAGIFETLHRYVPSDLSFQNERQRNGTWLTASTGLTDDLSFHVGWAHAFRAPGDPGQHNDSTNTPPNGVPGVDGTAGADSDNSADLITAALKYKLGSSLTLYTNFAATLNGPAAHYDLGAGGRSVTIDCHDANAAPGGLVASNPHCFTGTSLMGLSMGLATQF